MEDVSIRLSMEELQRRVLEEPWFEAEGFNRRAGLTIAGGSLLGVTTSLTTVLDKWKSEVGESADEEGAKGLIPFLPKEGAPYTTQVAWDSEEAKDVSNFLLRSWNLAPRELLRDVRDVQSNDLREDKRQLLIRVSDSISALAQGFQEADKASGCFFCSAFLSGNINCASRCLSAVFRLEMPATGSGLHEMGGVRLDCTIETAPVHTDQLHS